jgi:hypothetical protein
LRDADFTTAGKVETIAEEILIEGAQLYWGVAGGQLGGGQSRKGQQTVAVRRLNPLAVTVGLTFRLLVKK